MKYAFGRVRVDAEARSLTKGGQPLHLTRKAFDLLLLLLDQRPNAVTKAQIYERLWPDTFVSESSLQTLIREIREVIDDSETKTSWIRTVHGIGYGFAGDAVASDASLPPRVSPGPPAAWLIGESMRVSLHRGENILGRWPEAEVEIDLPTVSRRHARITIADAVLLEDLGSKNGTWLNDERVTAPRPVTDGDVVGFGSSRFTFRSAPGGRSTESADALPPDADLTTS